MRFFLPSCILRRRVSAEEVPTTYRMGRLYPIEAHEFDHWNGPVVGVSLEIDDRKIDNTAVGEAQRQTGS